MQLDYVKLIQGIALIISTTCCGFLIPLLVKSLGRERFNNMVKICGILVKSAEQVMKNSVGIEKKDFVLKQLKKQFPNMKHKDLENILESCVYELKSIQNNVNNYKEKQE